MTRNTSIAATIAVLALALAAPATYAQTGKKGAKPAAQPAPAPAVDTSGGVGKGDKEMSFSADYTDFGIGTTASFGFGVGKYLTDNFVLKLAQTLSVSDFDAGGVTSVNYAPYVAAEFNFRPPGMDNLMAYAGAGFGIDLDLTSANGGYSSDRIGMFWTPLAGLKYFLSERVAVTYGLSIRMPLGEETCTTTSFLADEVCADTETTTLENVLGFSIYY